MSTLSTSVLPALPLVRPSGRVSDQMNHAVYNSGPRHIPALRLKVNNSKIADLFPYFPLRLYAVRAIYLPKHTLNGLKVKANSDLLIQGFAPELVSGEPIGLWAFTKEEVERLALANVNSGAIIVEVMREHSAMARQVLTPYWLDWQGWSGYALQLAYSSHLTDPGTLRHLAFELSQRSDDAPTGLHTALAHLARVTNDLKGAVAACQQEILLHLDRHEHPTQGVQEATVLLGQLLLAHEEPAIAHAAFSLALWINSNHSQSLTAILPLLTDEEAVLETLARVSNLPSPPPNLPQLVATTIKRLGIDKRTFDKRLRATAAPRHSHDWKARLSWLEHEMPDRWLRKLGM